MFLGREKIGVGFFLPGLKPGAIIIRPFQGLKIIAHYSLFTLHAS
jgi:hypothetical protein